MDSSPGAGTRPPGPSREPGKGTLPFLSQAADMGISPRSGSRLLSNSFGPQQWVGLMPPNNTEWPVTHTQPCLLRTLLPGVERWGGWNGGQGRVCLLLRWPPGGTEALWLQSFRAAEAPQNQSSPISQESSSQTIHPLTRRLCGMTQSLSGCSLKGG